MIDDDATDFFVCVCVLKRERAAPPRTVGVPYNVSGEGASFRQRTRPATGPPSDGVGLWASPRTARGCKNFALPRECPLGAVAVQLFGSPKAARMSWGQNPLVYVFTSFLTVRIWPFFRFHGSKNKLTIRYLLCIKGHKVFSA